MVKQKQSVSRKTTGRRPAARRTCVLILGMHRSGTSALTRTLSLLGCQLPQRLMGAADGNDAGHWEPYRLVAYNEQFLQGLHSSWHDWRPLDLTGLSFERKADARKDILKIIEDDYGNAKLFIVKDPRICRFPTFFMETLEEAGIDVSPILIFRNPLEVFSSLEARKAFWPEGFSMADGALLWLSHVLEAERASRGYKRTLVTYDALLAELMNEPRGWAKATLPTYNERKDFFESIVNGTPDPIELLREHGHEAGAAKVRELVEQRKLEHGSRAATV